MTLAVAIYARSASDAVATIQIQIRECETLAARNGWNVECTYIDQRASGASASRPGLNALWSAIDAGEFQAVVVKDYSRLSRETALLRAFIEKFKAAGVRLIVVDYETQPVATALTSLKHAFQRRMRTARLA